MTKEELIAQIRLATGPSGELNRAIMRYFTGQDEVCSDFTGDLDCALRLVPKSMRWRVGRLLSGSMYADVGTLGSWQSVVAPTPALAICLAATMASEIEK